MYFFVTNVKLVYNQTQPQNSYIGNYKIYSLYVNMSIRTKYKGRRIRDLQIRNLQIRNLQIRNLQIRNHKSCTVETYKFVTHNFVTSNFFSIN